MRLTTEQVKDIKAKNFQGCWKGDPDWCCNVGPDIDNLTDDWLELRDLAVTLADYGTHKANCAVYRAWVTETGDNWQATRYVGAEERGCDCGLQTLRDKMRAAKLLPEVE